VLVAKRAIVDKPDGAGRMPIDLAIAANHDGMTRFLMKHGADLPEDKKEDPRLKEMQQEVERELLREQSKEDAEDNTAEELKFCENAFEESRLQLLHLAQLIPQKNMSLPLATLDRRIEDAVYLIEQCRLQIASLEERLAALEKDIADKQAKIQKTREDLARWQEEIRTMMAMAEERRREYEALLPLIEEARKAKIESDKMRDLCLKATDKYNNKVHDVLEPRLAQYEGEREHSLEEYLQIKDTMSKWLAERKQAMEMHMKAQSMLDRAQGELDALEGEGDEAKADEPPGDEEGGAPQVDDASAPKVDDASAPAS